MLLIPVKMEASYFLHKKRIVSQILRRVNFLWEKARNIAVLFLKKRGIVIVDVPGFFLPKKMVNEVKLNHPVVVVQVVVRGHQLFNER